MASEKLFEATPQQGLVMGIAPSIEPASGALWRTGRNAWFREASVEHALGKSRIVATSLQSRFLANAFTAAGQKRLYYEDSGVVRYSTGSGPSTLIDTLANTGNFWLEPWGDWLIASDFQNNLKIWKNTGGFVTITDAATQFAKARIIKKLAQHLIAYNTNVAPTGFHWCSADDPDTWTPSLSNSARNLNIRGLDSEIVCVADLGAAHAVYSRATMLLVRYVGPTQWFGTPQQALQGIGAVSALSSVSVGGYNFGLCRDGVFATDGNSFGYIDRPSIDRWVQEVINWNKASEVAGFYDARLQLVSWTVPVLTGGTNKAVLAVDTKNKSFASFTFLEAGGGVGLRREVFDFPSRAFADGLYFISQPNSVVGDFSLTSHLLDGSTRTNFKAWDYAAFRGVLSGEVRFGFADTLPDPEEDPESTIDWGDWKPLENRVPFGPRESIYVAIDLRTPDKLRLTGIELFGEKAGSVN